MPEVVVGVNAYGLVSEADSFLDGSVTAGPVWTGVPPDTKKRSVISATRLIERQTFNGTATEVTILDTISIDGGGSGYSALDVLTVSGGTFGEAAKIRVDTVDGSGVIQTATLIHAGTYTTAPSSPVSVTGGGGSSATFAVTTTDQVLALPRTGLVDCYGSALSSTTYPTIAKEGSFELAYLLSQDSDIEAAGDTASNLKRVKAGSAEVEYFRPEAGLERFPPKVQELISCLLAGQGGSSLSLAYRSGDGNDSEFDTYPGKYGLTGGF